MSQYMFPSRLFETNRFLVFRYSYNNKGGLALINKKTKETFLIYLENEYDGIVNNLDGGSNFQPIGYFTEFGQEYLVGFLEPYRLKAHVASDEFKSSVPKYLEKKKELQKIADSLEETDNQIVVLVRLKK